LYVAPHWGLCILFDCRRRQPEVDFFFFGSYIHAVLARYFEAARAFKRR
jgi:hypothetical protein